MKRFIAEDCPALAISLVDNVIWQEGAVVSVMPGSVSLRQRQEDFSYRTCLDADADEGVYAAGNLGDTVSKNG